MMSGWGVEYGISNFMAVAAVSRASGFLSIGKFSAGLGREP